MAKLSRSSKNKQDYELFPGEPDWGQWSKEQRKAKKREVGITRRLARGAIIATAETIVLAKEMPHIVTEVRRQKNVRKAERLEPLVRRSRSTAAIPETDLRKVEKSKLRKLGHGVLRALSVSNKKSYDFANQKAQSLATTNKERSRRRQQKPMGSVEGWAQRHIEDIDQKRLKGQQKRRSVFEEHKQAKFEEYLDTHPEFEEKLYQEEMLKARINSRWNPYGDLKYAKTYLFVERNIGSASKMIPRRGESPRDYNGSYDVLAKETLATAMRSKTDDGTIPLLSMEPWVNRADAAEQPSDFDAIAGDSRAYTDGANTAIWKLGFMQFDNEADIPYGRGQFNPDIEWSMGHDQMSMSIPFNPENELHAMVLGDSQPVEGQRLELSMPREPHYGDYSPAVNLRLSQAPVEAVVA